MTEFTSLTIESARDGLRKGEFSASELAKSTINSIEEARDLNVFGHETAERCLQMAKLADKRLAQGDAPDICGIPIGVKDLFCVKDVPAQAGSRILEGFIPAYESTVTDNLWRDGAVLAGKCSMDEFAMGSSNETAIYGPAISPWRKKIDGHILTDKLSPGGSSGGSAAAIAADLCIGAIGTDTGGSIRQPAAFCGVVGLKPTYGRCSRWGIIAFASSLDQAGPLTKTVGDAAIMLSAMASFDSKDSTSHRQQATDYRSKLNGDIRGKRIGIPREYADEKMSDEISSLWNEGAEKLAAMGAEIIEVSAPHTHYALPAYYVIAPAEASSNLARYDGIRYGRRAKITANESLLNLYEKSRAEGFGAEVRRRILIGTYVLSAGYYDAYYRRAQCVRALIRRDFDLLFDKQGETRLDALLTPTAPSPPFVVGEQSGDPVIMYLNDIFTVPASLAGLPAISLPGTLSSEGTPLALQLIGAPFAEGNLLNIAYALEGAFAFTAKPDRWW